MVTVLIVTLLRLYTVKLDFIHYTGSTNAAQACSSALVILVIYQLRHASVSLQQ
jgi:hypothetical protein